MKNQLALAKPHHFRLKRAGAFIVDDILGNTILGLLGLVVPVAGTMIAVGFYASTQDSLCGAGRSLGRAMVNQQLAMADGEAASHGRCLARNALRWILWLTVVCLIMDLFLFSTGNGRLMADRICGTRVWANETLEDQRYLSAAHDAFDLLD